MNLFAIVNRAERTVERIRVERQLQDQLQNEFETQREAFFGEAEIVGFNPRYKVDDDEIFVINNYELSNYINTAIHNINQVSNLSLDADVLIKSIFAAERTREGVRLYFQGFMRRQLLVGGWTLLGRRDTYRKLEDPGLTLGSSLVAFYEEGRGLFFRSYTLVSRFLNLETYFVEAADSDIGDVLGNDIFEVDDASIILENADSVMRKRFMAVKSSGILGRVTVTKIRQQASKFGIDIETRNGKIVFPAEKKKSKELLRLLLEGYYDGPLTGTKYVTNSQRPISD